MLSLSCSGSNEEAPSKAVNRAALPPPLVATARRAGREVIRLHLDGNAHASGPAAVGCEALPCHGGEEAPLKDLHLRAGESLRCIFQGIDKDLYTFCFLDSCLFRLQSVIIFIIVICMCMSVEF